jgi:hypothetical protein
MIEVVGSSEISIEDAIQGAVEKTAESLDHLRWFEVVETRGHIVDGSSIGHYQVVLKIGFTVNPDE